MSASRGLMKVEGTVAARKTAKASATESLEGIARELRVGIDTGVSVGVV